MSLYLVEKGKAHVDLLHMIYTMEVRQVQQLDSVDLLDPFCLMISYLMLKCSN